MSMNVTDKQALRDNANSIIGILENIAGFEPSDIDGDNVELRFEDECGVDTGCDVSIVDQSQKTADVMRALLDELEAKDKRIAEQAILLEGSDAILADYAETLDCAGDTDSILAGIVELQSRAEAAEKRIANLFSALKLIESEVSERFDMDDSKTNPGIKHAVEQAQSALSAGIALDTGE
jgi:hypothetical protein